MRYGDGGGVGPQGRAGRELIRRQAARMFADGMSGAQVAAELEVSTKSAYAWRRAWTAGRVVRRLWLRRVCSGAGSGVVRRHAPCRAPQDRPGAPERPTRCTSIRRILVHSSANQNAAATARALKLGKARTELDTLTRTAGTRHHPDAAAVTAKAAQISRHRRVGAYLHTTITHDPDTGKPVFTWHYDQTAFDAETAGDGWYALLTNLDPADADPADVLRRYKGQSAVEQRYATVKGPLAVAPMFLQTNRRITALITVICLALLIFSLIEREVRRQLAAQGHTDMTGFYAFDNRAVRPTARLILQALHDLRLIPAHDRQPPKIPHPGWLQAKLLALLNVDPTRPRGQ